MTYVYLLSCYDEYGAQDVIGTRSRDKLPELLARNWPWVSEGDTQEALAGLTKVLERSDEELADGQPRNRETGWDGAQLHVICLDRLTPRDHPEAP